MCGIAGFAGEGNRVHLENMTAKLSHRGPDGHGYYIDEQAHVFLGHRRLSILDIEHGAQPMWNGAGTIAVIFNGEIYNHHELRQELEQCGHRFRSDHSDTEVLIYGYIEWGEDLPARLNGMFAFAIYDKVKKRLFLARDRFGEKPLYYTHTKNLFAFASELTALAKHSNVGTSVNVKALQKLFAYGYLPAPTAFYEGSAKLPGGHCLCYDLGTGQMAIRSYWRFTLEPDDSLGDKDEPALVDELHGLIVQAAKRRLISDVPLGVFLSGGIDSSVVLGAVSESIPASRIKTFTIGFTEKSFDESQFARTVADHFSTDHYEKILGSDDARDLMTSVLGRLDEPLGDASILPTYLLSKFVREHVTVALSGDGGDELFAGYDPFAALKAAQIYDALVPGFVHKGLRSLANLIPISHKNMSLDFKIKRALMGLSYPPSIRLPVWMAPLEPDELNDLMNEPVDPLDLYSEAAEIFEECRHQSAENKAMTFFTRLYLQDDILVKVDRAAMMNSLESRAVFLDNDLVAFCQRLPSRFKYHKGERKLLLKRVAKCMLPGRIVERKKKGFGIPLAKWLKTVPAEPLLTLLPGVNSAYASHAFKSHRSGQQDHRLFLWSWLSAQYVANAQVKRDML